MSRAPFPELPSRAEMPPLVTAISRPLRSPDILWHRVVLVASGAVLVAAALLRVGPHGDVRVPVLDVPLPPSCTFRSLTGVNCPGCGLTRSIVCLVHGKLGQGWRYNPAGPLLLVLIAVQIPYRLAQLRRLAAGEQEFQVHRLTQVLLAALLLLLVGQWLGQLAASLWAG